MLLRLLRGAGGSPETEAPSPKAAQRHSKIRSAASLMLTIQLHAQGAQGWQRKVVLLSSDTSVSRAWKAYLYSLPRAPCRHIAVSAGRHGPKKITLSLRQQCSLLRRRLGCRSLGS